MFESQLSRALIFFLQDRFETLSQQLPGIIIAGPVGGTVMILMWLWLPWVDKTQLL